MGDFKRDRRNTRCEAITDIIQSVAMQEKALAGILDTAKEKPHDDEYQAYGKCKEMDEEQIELINAIARLEFLLTFKLAIFLDCACPEEGCKEDKDKDKDKCPHKKDIY